MLSEVALQLTVWILGSNGISRFAWERDAFLVDGAHFELVEVPRPESLHGVIQVVGVGLKDQVGEQRFRTVGHNCFGIREIQSCFRTSTRFSLAFKCNQSKQLNH